MTSILTQTSYVELLDNRYFLNGNVGTTVLPNVALVTPAKEPYQAIIAVRIPRYPPISEMEVELVNVPTVRRKNVSVRRTNIVAITPFVPKEAIIIYALKIVHANRKMPVASYAVAAGREPAMKCTYAANAIQKAPYDVNAKAPKVLALLNSHIPAKNWANPP